MIESKKHDMVHSTILVVLVRITVFFKKIKSKNFQFMSIGMKVLDLGFRAK